MLLPVSIKRNIVMNDKAVDEERLARIVTLVGLEDKIASLEMGLETPLVRHITENGTEFSGGEVQKLLLARAIYKESPVLILDEPTAARIQLPSRMFICNITSYLRTKRLFLFLTDCPLQGSVTG